MSSAPSQVGQTLHQTEGTFGGQVKALGKTGKHALWPQIAALARNPEPSGPELTAECVRAIGALRHPGASDIVAWALSHPDWQVRSEAAEATGRIGFTFMANGISELLADDVWWVRFRAGQALSALGEPGRNELHRLATGVAGRAQRTAALIIEEKNLA